MFFLRPAYSDCYANSFPEFRAFVDKVIGFEITTEQYKLKKNAIIQEVLLTRNESDRNDTSLSFEYDFDAQTNSLNLSSDLSFWKQSIKNKIIAKRADIKENEIFSLDNTEYTRLGLSILSIVSAETYLSIFSDRRQILLDQINFYDRRIKMGSGEFQEKLNYEQELIELSNKQMSAEIKKQTEILMSELTEFQIGLFNTPIDISNAPKQFVCNDIPKIILALDLKIDLAQLKIDQIQKKYSPKLLGSITSTLDNEGRDNTSGKLILNIPIYQGNMPKLQMEKFKQELSTLKNEKTMLLIQLEKAAKERAKIDQILISSVNSIDAQILTKQNALKQINIKKNLGGSIFEEKAQISKEITLLKEARVGLMVDIFTAWLNFMSARGDLLNDYS